MANNPNFGKNEAIRYNMQVEAENMYHEEKERIKEFDQNPNTYRESKKFFTFKELIPFLIFGIIVIFIIVCILIFA